MTDAGISVDQEDGTESSTNKAGPVAASTENLPTTRGPDQRAPESPTTLLYDRLANSKLQPLFIRRSRPGQLQRHLPFPRPAGFEEERPVLQPQ